jgi:hypothetical protein
MRTVHTRYPPIDRRAFCLALACSIAGSGCRAGRPDEPPREGLARLLGLEGSEAAWLDALAEGRQRQLYDALLSGEPPAQETIELLMRVFGRRDRLFAYVGYPPMPDRLEGCDGLLRE